MQLRVSRAENLEPESPVPTTLIKRRQGPAEAFQQVTEPGETAGCSRPASPSTLRNGGDLKNCQDTAQPSTDVDERHEKQWRRDPSDPG